MFPFHWLTTLQQQYRSRFRQGARIRQHRSRHACTPCIARATPRHAVELLEDRTLLTAFTVVNTNDSGEGSLRAAIAAANANVGADTISFDVSLRGRTIVLGDELQITDDLTITGLGAEQLTLDGNGDSRIFKIYDGSHAISSINVEITGLTLTNGFSDQSGGAISNSENLSILNVSFENNSAYSGGAIWAKIGTVSVTDSYFLENSASSNGGAIYNEFFGGLFISRSQFVSNSASNGGGVYSSGYGGMSINNSNFVSNKASMSGGGIYNNGHFLIEETTISGNTALQGGGLSHKTQSFFPAESVLKNSTITNNTATDHGGGISNFGTLAIINSTLSGNHSGNFGGAISQTVKKIIVDIPMNDDTNVITVSDLKIGESIPRWITVYKPNYLKIFNSTITGNSAEQSGGGIATLPGSNQFTSSTITITNSIVAGNTAESSAQVEGTFFDNSNIIQDSIEGLLDPVLRDNGGPTKTHALLPGSAAINAGDNQAATDAGFTTDQRGGDHQRIYAGTADIGAFEYHALNLVVDTLSDEDDGDYSSGHLSLREAIKLANQTFDTDQITFSNTLSGGTIMLESELLISTGMHIVGLGQGQLTLDGGNDSRIFRVNDGDTYSDAGVEISGLSLKHGNADRGGAILNYEELLLTDVALSENVAAEDGGAIYHASGQLRVTDSFFSYNRAQKNGGGIYNSHQDLIVEETTFYRNTSGAGGGGIYSIYGSKLKHSRPDTLPGPAFPVLRSIYTPLYFLNYGDTEYNVVAILHSSFLENEASSGGGVYMTQKNYTNPLWNCDAVTVSGLGGTADVSSQQNSDKISLTGNKIVGCTFVGNTAVRGGGLFTSSQLTISDSTFTENSAYYGGGVYHTARTLTVQNSTVSGNSATRSGGGIYSKPDYPFSSPVPINLELIRSEALVSIPLAPEVMFLEIGVDLTTGLSSDQVALDSASSSFDANSTNALSATDAVISSAADLLFVIKSSVLRIQNSTITGNSAGANGGGLYLINADNSYIRSSNDITNSIIAGNSAPENAQVEGGFDGDFNIIQDSIEGLLDPVLRDNGGSTKTHALLPGSAAIDAGSNQAATDAGLTTDQRGEGSQRIKEGTVDIGAFEVQAPFTQVDFRFANSNSRKLNNGEQEQLPENRIWLDEAGNYWVEIWLHTPTSTTAGIQSGYFDLNYNTSAATAVSIEYGAAFAHNQSGTINQNTGTIEHLSAETSRTDIGDDQYTLFARIQFHANMTESTDGERGRHPRTSVVNPDISVNQLNIRLTGGTASEAIVNQSPGDPIWEDPQPASDIPAFDDLVLANLQFDYYVQPDNFFAASHITPNNEYAYHSGLTLIDLPGSPVVDEAGNETGMLNELDSLVGSRDETEDDLPKKTTSTDHDSSAEDDSDRFFTDLTEETELIVF